MMNVIHRNTYQRLVCFVHTNNSIDRFKICSNVFDLIKLEAICNLLRKPVLCKQKDFDYTVSLFS